MLLCPTCREAFREPATVCPRDDSPLQPAVELDWRIGSQVGNYRLLDLLGKGGMGMVYRAEHLYIGKGAAIKVLSEQAAQFPGAVERLLQEARAVSLIGHPNIIEISDFGETPDGATYFVMELLSGRPLDSLIESEGRLSLMRAINIANQIGRGLRAAHDMGIVHRDLKPANVMLEQRPGRREIVRRHAPRGGAGAFTVERESSYDFVKILDFGASTMFDADPIGDDSDSLLLGTPHYMAPEAARQGPVDHRFDIYALGVLFYEMLTGAVPFDGETPIDVMAAHAKHPVPPMEDKNPLAEVTPAAERLVQRAMAKNPADRPQTMDQFLKELQLCYGDETFLRDVDHQMPAAAAAGIHPRPRSLTEELQELFAQDPQGDDPPKRRDE